MPIVDIVCRELRVRFDMLAVQTHWARFGQPDDVFPPHEFIDGIHAGDIETSLMLHLAPELVRMERAEVFRSAQTSYIQEFVHLRGHGPHAFGWMGAGPQSGGCRRRRHRRVGREGRGLARPRRPRLRRAPRRRRPLRPRPPLVPDRLTGAQAGAASAPASGGDVGDRVDLQARLPPPHGDLLDARRGELDLRGVDDGQCDTTSTAPYSLVSVSSRLAVLTVSPSAVMPAVAPPPARADAPEDRRADVDADTDLQRRAELRLELAVEFGHRLLHAHG